jgi:hypothetical protein
VAAAGTFLWVTFLYRMLPYLSLCSRVLAHHNFDDHSERFNPKNGNAFVHIDFGAK